MFSKRQRQRAPGFLGSLCLFAMVSAPIIAVSSCSEPGSLDDSLGKETLAQLPSCSGGSSSGGTFSLGGSVGRGGASGTGGLACPNDGCSTFICKEGTCLPEQVTDPGTTCVDSAGTRGRCAAVDANGDGRFDYTQCCINGCLDERYLTCIGYAQQSDNACGRLGSDCASCGDCRNCGTSGTCVAAGGESCPGGVCNGATCCTGCINGTTCYVDAVANCGSSGGSCENCNDNRACTTDTCVNGSCQHSNVTGPCDDGNECTNNDTCSGSNCAGTTKSCDDGNECTTDGCNPMTGCTTTPRTGTCNDGNQCTGPDTCTNGTCGGAARDCDDGNQCTDDSCNPMTGCVHELRTGTCDDGNACTTGDRCVDGMPPRCVPTSGPMCDDGNPCNMDVADCGTNTCSHPAANDGDSCGMNPCQEGQTCNNGACGGGTPKDCDDDDPCTEDACSMTTGCTHDPAPDDTECNDMSACTTGDSCQGGDCVGEPVECVAIDDCHEVGDCNAMTGTCNDPRKSDDEPCGRTGMCRNGTCEGDGVVDPMGGTGPGGGGPGGGDTGGTGPGAAGEGTGGTAGSNGFDGPLFKRDPGGCACRVTAPPTAPPGYGALALTTALLFLTRRRRRAA
jgi:MYXO-CTERM domain-containing protein